MGNLNSIRAYSTCAAIWLSTLFSGCNAQEAGNGNSPTTPPETPAAIATPRNFTNHLYEYHELTKRFQEPRRQINELLASTPDTHPLYGTLILLDRGCASVPGRISVLKALLMLIDKGGLSNNTDAIRLYVANLPPVMERTSEMSVRFGASDYNLLPELSAPADIMYQATREAGALLKTDAADQLTILVMSEAELLRGLDWEENPFSLYLSPFLQTTRNKVPETLALQLAVICRLGSELHEQLQPLREASDRLHKKKGIPYYLLIPEAISEVEYSLNAAIFYAAMAGLANAEHGPGARAFADQMIQASLMSMDRAQTGFMSEQFAALLPGLEQPLEEAADNIGNTKSNVQDLRKTLASLDQ